MYPQFQHSKILFKFTGILRPRKTASKPPSQISTSYTLQVPLKPNTTTQDENLTRFSIQVTANNTHILAAYSTQTLYASPPSDETLEKSNQIFPQSIINPSTIRTSNPTSQQTLSDNRYNFFTPPSSDSTQQVSRKSIGSNFPFQFMLTVLSTKPNL